MELDSYGDLTVLLCKFNIFQPLVNNMSSGNSRINCIEQSAISETCHSVLYQTHFVIDKCNFYHNTASKNNQLNKFATAIHFVAVFH